MNIIVSGLVSLCYSSCNPVLYTSRRFNINRARHIR